MNRIRNYRWPVAACLMMLLLAASCIMEETAETDPGLATLRVRYGTRAADATDPNAIAREGISTLRLILVQDEKVVSNYKQTLGTDDNDPLLYKEVTFLKFPKKPTTIYAIANEESVELDFSNYTMDSPFGKTQIDELMEKVIENPARKYFPKTSVALAQENRYLPMAGWGSCSMETDDEVVNIELTRMVAKLRITFVNQTREELPISRICFGRFFADRSYLFDHEGTLPEGISYPIDNYIQTTEGSSIAIGASATMTDYLCESAAGEGAYTLGLNDLTDFPLVPIRVNRDGELKELSYIRRNECVDITATAHPTGLELLCQVLPWDVSAYEVDYKNELSYTSLGWKTDTYAHLSGNEVTLRSDVAAEFEFTIQTPNTARWFATLSNYDDFSFVDGTDSGDRVQDEEGTPLTQTVKVRVNNADIDVDDDDRIAVLHVYAVIAGKNYELDLVGGGSSTGEPARYTLVQTTY